MRKITQFLLVLSLCLTVLTLPPATAQNQTCLKHFVDGKAPVFIRASLQTHTVALCYEAFAVMHSGVSRTPLWSAEHLTRTNLVQAREIKRKDAFHADENIPSVQRAELSDYAHSGYDRGHMAPAADMPTARANDQSFSLANMVPQARINNERTWAGVEKATRHYVSHAQGSVFVFTGPVYRNDAPRTIGPNQVWVPTHLFKLVYDPGAGRAWAFWVENTDQAHAGHPISYADLVSRTGIEFLPGLTPTR